MHAPLWLHRMAQSRRRMASVVMLVALVTGSATSGAVTLIGKQGDGWFLIPTNQKIRSAGDVTLLDQRPVDMALRPDGTQLAVMTTNLTYLLDPATGQVTQQFDKQDRNVAGIAYSPDGTRLYYAKGKDHKIGVVSLDATGKATFEGDIDTGAKTWPAGLSVAPDGRTLYVALFGTNSLGVVNLADRKVTRTLPVGSSPFGAYVSPDGTAVYTSNWGGPLPQSGESIDPLFPVNVDPRTGAAAAGSVSVYDVMADRMRPEIAVGLHPTAMTFDKAGFRLYVANSNEDTISVLDLTGAAGANAEVERISVRPDAALPFGSMPNGLTLSLDQTLLYVANGGNNAIAVVALDARARPPGTYSGPHADAPATSGVTGFIPTEWYPIAVALVGGGTRLAVANNKGEGSLGTPQRAIPNGGKSVFSLTGSVTFVSVPNAEQLAAYTAQFNENNRYTAALADSVQPPRADAAPVPVPARIGEPSVFKHVLYIIKENRTYDQVLGDMGTGNGEPKLAQFPRRVSPNHHALADRFGLLDNYYASSVNSADGHQWTDEAIANVFAERVYGFFPTNSTIPGVTPYGTSSLDLPPDSLWSNALAHNVSLRNYGEDGINTVTKDGQEIRTLDWAAMYKDWRDKTGIFAYTANAITPPLLATEDHAYPAFETAISDQIRADEWLREFNGFVEMGNLPQLSVILLPDDHTSGTKSGAPTPEAQVADNDLAFGRIIDALSHSPYWRDTAVFVTEDDAQNGVDHVDGHRTIGYVVSAYNKQGIVDSALYNQTSMVRTIEQILGLPPMNQFDLTAPLMTTMFADTPDFSPYTVIPNQIPLDTLNGQASDLKGQALEDAKVSDTLDFSVADATDPAILNPIVWRATMGNRPYPHFAWKKNGLRHRDDDD